MLKNIQLYLKAFTNKRITELSDHMHNADKEYGVVSEQCIKLYEQITKVLPTEHQHLLLDYEENEGRRQALVQDMMYRQGLRDGISVGVCAGSGKD